jgi:hypothetical protein
MRDRTPVQSVAALVGVVGLMPAKTAERARTYLLGGGDWIPANTADNWLHFGLGIGLVALGSVSGRSAVRTATTA